MKFIIYFLMSICLSSCAIVNSTYVPDPSPVCSANKGRSIEYLTYKPTRKAYRIGVINVIGNGYAQEADILEEAVKVARGHGGDCIVMEKAGVETQTIHTPGYSSFQSNGYSNTTAYSNLNANGSYSANGYGTYNPNGYGAYSAYGQGAYSANGYEDYQSYASQQASAYSVGPSVYTIYSPWRVFSLWVYLPSQPGVIVNENSIITGFLLKSDAEAAGVRIGDQIVGFDGYDLNDENFKNHWMNTKPGDKVTLNVRRANQKREFQITMLPN